MKRFLEFIKSLKFVFMPNWWIRNHSTDPVVDKIINKIVDEDLIVGVGHYYAFTKNHTEVWIQNYPYAYATVEHKLGLPKRTTALKFRKYVEAKRLQQIGNI